MPLQPCNGTYLSLFYIREVQEHKDGSQLNGTPQSIFCADRVIAFDRNIHSSRVKKNTTSVLGANKEDSIVANACLITRIRDEIIMYRQVINQVKIWQDEDTRWFKYDRD